MTLKQIFLRLVYPFWRRINQNTNKGNMLVNTKNIQSVTSFYQLSAADITNQPVSFNSFQGKKVLIVNTASNCGYTAQYAELQQLHQSKPDLIILAFPSNEFGEQEPGNNAEIADFCRDNYRLTFPMMGKTLVLKGAEQNPVYHWLSHSTENGWNNHAPEWNFGKYLINENGLLTHYFGPAVSPLDGVGNAISH